MPRTHKKCWSSGHSSVIGNEGQQREETAVPRFHTNQHMPRHGSVVNTGEKLMANKRTVPWEERCDEAQERKTDKYSELMESVEGKDGSSGYSQWK